MRLFLCTILLIYATILNAKCTLYELESDEDFKVVKIGNDIFLSLLSNDFNINFLLECKKNTQIYSTIEQNQNLSNKDNFLQIKTSLDIEKIKASPPKRHGDVKQIIFFLDDIRLKSVFKKNTLTLTKPQDNEDTDYIISKADNKKSSMPLGFECTKEYFFNQHNIQAIYFENEKLNADYILQRVYKWRTKGSDSDNEKLISWQINCKNWINIIKNIDLQDLQAVDKQILFQASKTHKTSEKLLLGLQQSHLQGYQIPVHIIEDFISSMNALKTLEKNKSKYKVFSNINNIFYIRNNKDLKTKIDYILSNNKSHEYYDLLSNTKAGSFIDSSNFKIDIIPIKLTIYAIDVNKDFLVIHMQNSINLNNNNTQFATYKLSNSFCSYLNTNIKKANQTLVNKIELVDYCLSKEFGDAYVATNKPIKQNTYTQQVPSNTQISDTKQSYSPPPTTTNNQSKKGTCSIIDNAKICIDISRNNIATHIKEGFKIPTIEQLQDNFDSEEYEGKTIYANNNSYFFFNEDEGWETISELSEDIPIDLILVR